MKRLLFVIYVVLASSYRAGPVAAPADGRVARVAWIGGCWEGRRGNAVTIEQWLPHAGSSMPGISRSVSDGRTTFLEFLEITEVQNKLAYSAALGIGKPATVFTEKTLTDGEIVFENLAHDFPQRVIYRRGAGRLDARIEGTLNGKLESEDFHYVKAACSE